MSFGRQNAFEFEKSLFDEIKELTFDTLTILVSLLDIFSDIYITYMFWTNSQYTYFYISISILILTHLSYCVLFVHLFKFKYPLIYIIALFPISPFLSFVLYFTANSHNKLSKYLYQLFNIKPLPQNKNAIQERDPTTRWIEDNLRKHIGFIFESFLESFGSFILQLYVLLMVNNDGNSGDFLCLSMFLSLLSISMSFYVFCESIYWKLFIFNYLCVLCDVFKLFTLIVVMNAMDSVFLLYIWLIKLVFITSIAALYLSIQFIWTKIDRDLNYNWYQMTRNIGGGSRRRSISRSQSQSKSKSKSTPKLNNNRSKSKSTSTHLSTFHISSNSANKSRRRHRSKLWSFLTSFIEIKSAIVCEILFVVLFTVLVLLMWPFIMLFLEISSFSLIAFVIFRYNTSRFLSIHWHLWQYVFGFLFNDEKCLRNSNLNSNYNHNNESRSQTCTDVTLSPTEHTNTNTTTNTEDDLAIDLSYDRDYELSQISQISAQTELDATELEVRLNTLANSGGNRHRNLSINRDRDRSKTKKTKKNHKNVDDISYDILSCDIPWSKSRDLLIRLCTINYIFAQYRESKKLCKYLSLSLQNDCFNSVEWQYLRSYSSNQFQFAFRYNHENIIEKWHAITAHYRHLNFFYFLYKKCELLLKWFQIFIVLPSYLASQMLSVFYPFLLLFFYYPRSSKIVYISMLFYIVFCAALLFVFPSIYRFTQITSCIHHNSILYFSSYNSNSSNSSQTADIERKICDEIKQLYQNLVATQLRTDLLNKRFGADICELILSYLAPFHIVCHQNADELNQLMNENEDDEEIMQENLQICVTPAAPKTRTRANNTKYHTNLNHTSNQNASSDHSGYDNDTGTDHSV